MHGVALINIKLILSKVMRLVGHRSDAKWKCNVVRSQERSHKLEKSEGEAELSLPYSTDDKNIWSYTSISPTLR
jgi:hypothetical protein